MPSQDYKNHSNGGSDDLHSFSILPVTALCTVKLAAHHLLISGQGPWLKVYDYENSHLLTQCKIFGRQTIHGVTSVGGDEDHHTNAFLLIWGEQYVALCVCDLTIRSEDGLGPLLYLNILGTQSVGDWILHGVIYEAIPGNIPVAYVLTAHNVLYQVGCNNGPEPGKYDLFFGQASSGPRSVLYSAHLNFVSWDCILVASGTVFGEVILWSCRLQEQQTNQDCNVHHVFLGHKGSVFGVCISDTINVAGEGRRFLASCSDDRTIRLWNIDSFLKASYVGDFNELLSPKNDSTGFSTNSKSHNATEGSSIWAHLSRIWNVKFLHDLKDKPYMISVGEDGTCQLWRVELYNIPRLQNIAIDRHHSGKNVWSVSQTYLKGEWRVFTGGADGAIIRRSYLSRDGDDIATIKPLKYSFREIFKSCDSRTICKSSSAVTQSARSSALKQYATLDADTVIMSTDRGEVLAAKVEKDYQLLSCHKLFTPEFPITSLLTPSTDDFALMSTENGDLLFLQANPLEVRSLGITLQPRASMCLAWHKRVTSDYVEICIVAATLSPAEIDVIWMNLCPSSSHQTLKLDLPSSFVPTSAAYDEASNTLILGSRAGALAVYAAIAPKTSVYRLSATCIRHVHGSDSVTCISFLDSIEDKSIRENYFLSTGRDGHYVIHKMVPNLHDSSEVPAITMVHKSSPPFGPYIEGAYLKDNDRGDSMKDLILYGFRSTEFVAWNETLQSMVFSIECGGAHRSWTFRGETDNDKMSFIWTKAGHTNFYASTQPNHQTIQSGSHGREIKALAVSDALIVTGAEDTKIRVFPHSSILGERIGSATDRGSRVLDNHTTGIQHLAFCGQYLFSSAGAEEFFAWRIYNGIPHVGLGVVFECALQKDPTADARIPCFSVISNSPKDGSYLIAAVLSNGKIKILTYSHAKFENVREMNEGSFCLSQVQLLRSHPGRSLELLTAGTNGVLNMRQTCPTVEGIDDIRFSQRVHQSNIHALVMIELNSSRRLVLSSGDDNAIALSVMDMDNRQMRSICFQTLIIPKAHAAAITAITVLACERGSENSMVLFASTGNDQHVNVWQVRVKHEPDNTVNKALACVSDMQFTRLCTVWTSVADIAAMELVLRTRRDRYDLLIAGVGMEMIRIKIG